MNKILFTVLASAILFAFTGRSIAQPHDFVSKKVIATTQMVGDIVKNVGGDRVSVKTLLGAGMNPHLYKPTRSDIALLTQGDLIFTNGLLLEGKMVDAFDRLKGAGKKVVEVASSAPKDMLLEPPEFQGHFDPHLWMDPVAWSAVSAVVQQALTEADPAGENIYRANLQVYRDKLAALDRYAQSILGTVVESSRVLVTAHDAFNYFGKRYRFEVIGIQGISTESEAGVRDVERIVELLVSRKIQAVFIESTVSERNVRALIEGAKARGHELKIGGELYSDAMGLEGTYEGSYVGMIDHNLTTIARALGGIAPDKGMSGLLSGVNK